MTLYRANNRHPVDPRILIIEDMEEFALWRERSQLRFNGLICAYPASAEELSQAAREIHAALGSMEVYRFIRMTDAEQRLRAELERAGICNNTQDIVVDVSNAFHGSVSPERTPASSSVNQLRVNCVFPEFFHAHAATMTLAFSQAGSMCWNANLDEPGEEYGTKPGEVLLFDEHVPHKAPKWDKSWETNPRVNLVI